MDEQRGYLVMRLLGQWYTYCSDDWDQLNSDAFCKYRGFNGGVHEFKKSPLDTRSFGNVRCPLVVHLTCS